MINDEIPVMDWKSAEGRTVHVYRSPDGQYRWRLRAGNGEIVATGESHPTRFNAVRAAHDLFPEVDS